MAFDLSTISTTDPQAQVSGGYDISQLSVSDLNAAYDAATAALIARLRHRLAGAEAGRRGRRSTDATFRTARAGKVLHFALGQRPLKFDPFHAVGMGFYLIIGRVEFRQVDADNLPLLRRGTRSSLCRL